MSSMSWMTLPLRKIRSISSFHRCSLRRFSLKLRLLMLLLLFLLLLFALIRQRLCSYPGLFPRHHGFLCRRLLGHTSRITTWADCTASQYHHVPIACQQKTFIYLYTYIVNTAGKDIISDNEWLCMQIRTPKSHALSMFPSLLEKLQKYPQ